MSAAMVDFRTPPPPPTSDRFPSRNPRQGQIPSLSDPPSMNPQSGFPPAPPAGKPSPAAGLSKPRFVKVRKQLPSSRVKPAVVSDPPMEDGRSRGIREQLPSWNPFVSENSSNSRNVGSGFSFGSEGSRSSDGNVFVFGKTGESLSRNSSGNSSSRSFGSFESSEFVFGASSNAGLGKSAGASFSFGSEGSVSVMESAGLSRNSSFGSSAGSFSVLSEEMRRLNLEKAASGDDKGGFVFSSTSLKESSILESREGSFSKVHDGMAKLNLQNTGNGNDFSKSGVANDFVFGSRSKMKQAEEMQKSDPAVFLFGNDVTRSSGLGQNSSVGFGEGSVSKLPDEMKKLNIDNDGNEDGFEKTKDGDDTSRIDKSNVFNSGSSSMQKPSKEKKKSDSGAFDFWGETKKSTNLGQNSTSGLGEGSYSKLPDEMRKLNIKAGHGDGFEKTKHTDSRSKGDGKSTFVFGSGSVEKLPDEIKKLNIGSRPESKTSKAESSEFAADAFVFRGRTKESSVSSQTSAVPFSSFDKRTTSEMDGKSKLNTEGLKKVKGTGCSEEVDANSGFIFDSCSSASSSFGGKAINVLHADMEKLDISSKAKNLDGSTPLKFTFQTCEQNPCSSMGADLPWQVHDHLKPTTTAAPSSHTSSSQSNFQDTGTEFIFMGKPEVVEIPHMEFHTPKQDTSRLSAENLFTRTHQNVLFSTRKGDVKATRRKRRDTSRKLASVHRSFSEQFDSMQNGSLENPEVDPAGGYSPMDYSPYQENLVTDQYSREASVASDESVPFIFRGTSTDTWKSASADEREELVSATQRLEIDEDDVIHGEQDNNAAKVNVQVSFAAETSYAAEQTSELGKASNMRNYKDVVLDGVARTASMEAEAGTFRSTINRQDSNSGPGFTFAANLQDFGDPNFNSVASPSVQGPSSTSKRNYRRRSRTKAGQDSRYVAKAKVPLASPSLNLPSFTTSSVHLPPAQGQKGISFVPQSEGDDGAGKSREPEGSQMSNITAATSLASQETCEKWRLRGNQAYENGHLSKAEDYYTRGVSSISPKETSRSCIRPLTLCYSNRAATRMSLGRMREALCDCKMALSIDPYFVRAQVRAANCHLALGEIGDALKNFKKCLQSENDIGSDQKIFVDASDGLQKAQRVADLTGQAAELLLKRTSNDAAKALQIISEALTISPYSESLFEMKAEALLMQRSYEEVIQLCEQTLELTEKNAVEIETGARCKKIDNSEYMKVSPVRLWRWRLISKSYFHLGKLEEALEVVQKHDEMKPVADKSPESSTSLAVIVRELLRLKAAGNEAFQAGRHSEAVEYYTAALSCNAESRPFAAICFCNRAAAYQALGQITDAIADCSLAIALDASYPKAISRRATLHEMIRDYGQAANDLHRLISHLEKQFKDSQGALGRSTGNGSDINRARVRLSTVEAEARKGISLDLYKILGIEPSCSASDVKKAYRKAALRHHPDKAGQFLARSENVDDGLWREVVEEVHADADRLFKMIGEAYTILSDPTKRLQYEAEEEMRTTLKKGYERPSTPRTPADYCSPYDRGVNTSYWRPRSSSHRW